MKFQRQLHPPVNTIVTTDIGNSTNKMKPGMTALMKTANQKTTAKVVQKKADGTEETNDGH